MKDTVRIAILRALPWPKQPVDLQLPQKICDIGRCPIHRPDELAPHHAIAIDDVGFRKLEGAVKIAALLPRIAHCQQIDIVIFEKLVIGILIDIDADPDDGDALGFHPPLHLDQRGHFLHTRRTPGRPEIEHHDLPVIIA